MIIVEPCAGLGNRLLGLATAYTVSKRLDRELVVIWKREVGCNIRAKDLFELPMRVVEISENGYSKEPAKQLTGNFMKMKWRARAKRFLECDDVEQMKKDKGYDGLYELIRETPVIYLKSFGPVCETEASCFSFLKPCEAIREKGKALLEQIEKDIVGVHIRRTDHTEAIANSPLSLFIERIEQEAAEGAAGFFIATDDAETKGALKERLGGIPLIFHETGIIDRNSKEGIEDALIEMLALSRCRKILGSYNSTFSLLPSYIGAVPLEIIKKER